MGGQVGGQVLPKVCLELPWNAPQDVQAIKWGVIYSHPFLIISTQQLLQSESREPT